VSRTEYRYSYHWADDFAVPMTSSKHPNLTQGLAALTLLYFPKNFPSRLASLQLILASSSPTAEEMLAGLVDLDPPPIIDGKTAIPTEMVELYLSTPDGPLLPLRVKAAEDPDELNWLHENGEGLWEVEISGEYHTCCVSNLTHSMISRSCIGEAATICTTRWSRARVFRFALRKDKIASDSCHSIISELIIIVCIASFHHLVMSSVSASLICIAFCPPAPVVFPHSLHSSYPTPSPTNTSAIVSLKKLPT
jgi:hypothetical protein